MNTFGEEVAKRRRAMGLNQTELAERIGLSGSAISRIEKAGDGAVHPKTRVGLEKILGILPSTPGIQRVRVQPASPVVTKATPPTSIVANLRAAVAEAEVNVSAARALLVDEEAKLGRFKAALAALEG